MLKKSLALSAAAAVVAAFAVTSIGHAEDDPAPQVLNAAIASGALAADIATLKLEYARPDAIPFPDDNPFTPGKAALGHKLFFEPALSGSGVISCATCHNPGLGWEDGLATGVGHNGAPLGRHTPTILNLAWGELFFWDGRASTLEDQALGPIQAAAEMNMNLEKAIGKLSGIREYVAAFEDAFPGEGLKAETIGKAIATFERTIVSGEAPFDRWVAGDADAISESAQRGFVLFNDKANCAVCHAGWRFTDDGFHDIGVASSDIGRAEHLPIDAMRYAFKTPTLRNAAERAPYMHDGSEATLRDVVDFYDAGFEMRSTLSTSISTLNLSEQEKSDLVAFLQTLSSEDDPIAVPRLPR